MPTLTPTDLSSLQADDHGGYNIGGHLASQYDGSLKTANNLEVFRRINALLDDTLDLSALPGLAQPHTKAAAMKQEPQPTLDNAQWNYQDALPYRSGPSIPASLEHLLGNLGTASTGNMPAAAPSSIPSTGADMNLAQIPPTYSHEGPLSSGLAGMNLGLNFGQMQHNYPQDIYNVPSFTGQTGLTGFPQVAHNTGSHFSNYAPTSTTATFNGNSTKTNPHLIQGAISNRTLEQLTETLTRPCRPIKGDTSKLHSGYSPDLQNTSDGLNYHPYPAYEQQQHHQQLAPPQYHHPQQPQQPQQPMLHNPYAAMPQDNSLSRLFGRASTPNDTDTSGFCSEPSVDTTTNALVDLMNTLSLAQPALSSQPPVVNQPPLGQLDLLRALGQGADMTVVPRRTDGQLLSGGLDFSDKMRSLNVTSMNPIFSTNTSDPYSIEKAAKLYRNAATICEATCTWSGQLPPKVYKNATYSCKVFLGGVPWDITETGLQHAFKQFGSIKIEWPGKEGKHPRYPTRAGYVYVLFETPKAVASLLQSCTQDFSSSGEYFFKISSRRMRSKEVQVIPWVLSDSNCVRQPSQRLDPNKTVFVGALHGVLTAEALANIMNDLFGNVVYAGIDTDKHKYPIGSGRVTFSSHKSYMKAVNAAFVEIKTPKFTKKIQIDPYLEDSLCSVCALQQGPFFCRDLVCFRYYCRTCWQWTHAFELMQHHKPLMRNSRGNATHTSVV